MKVFVPCNLHLYKAIHGSSVVKKEINVYNAVEKPGPPCNKCPSQPIPKKVKNNKYPKGGTLKQGKIHPHTDDQPKILSEFMLFLA